MLRAARLVFVFAVCVPLAGNNMRPPDEYTVYRECYECEDASCEQPLERISCSPERKYCYTLLRRNDLSDDHVRAVYGDETYVGAVKRRGCTSACALSKSEGYTCVQCSSDLCNGEAHRANIAPPSAPLNSSLERTTWEELQVVWRIATSDARLAAIAIVVSSMALVVLAALCFCAYHLTRYAHRIVNKKRPLRDNSERRQAAEGMELHEQQTNLEQICGTRASTFDTGYDTEKETNFSTVSLAGSFHSHLTDSTPVLFDDFGDFGRSHDSKRRKWHREVAAIQAEQKRQHEALFESLSFSSKVSIDREDLPLNSDFYDFFHVSSLSRRSSSVSINMEPDDLSGSCASVNSVGLVNYIDQDPRPAPIVYPPVHASHRQPSPTATAPLAFLEENDL